MGISVLLMAASLIGVELLICGKPKNSWKTLLGYHMFVLVGNLMSRGQKDQNDCFFSLLI